MGVFHSVSCNGQSTVPQKIEEALGSAAARFVLAPSNGEREMQEHLVCVISTKQDFWKSKNCIKHLLNNIGHQFTTTTTTPDFIAFVHLYFFWAGGIHHGEGFKLPLRGRLQKIGCSADRWDLACAVAGNITEISCRGLTSRVLLDSKEKWKKTTWNICDMGKGQDAAEREKALFFFFSLQCLQWLAVILASIPCRTMDNLGLSGNLKSEDFQLLTRLTVCCSLFLLIIGFFYVLFKN